jgi:hypothetical protein
MFSEDSRDHESGKENEDKDAQADCIGCDFTRGNVQDRVGFPQGPHGNAPCHSMLLIRSQKLSTRSRTILEQM